MEITPYAPEHRLAVTALAGATLDLPEDAAEATAIVNRLLDPPAGRPTVRLVSGGGTGACFASLNGATGYVDLVMVDASARRRGIARGLVTAAERTLAELGATEVHIAGHAPCYGWPGIDVRYTPAVCLALALGYEQYRTGWNMTVDLAAVRDPAAAEARLAAAGVTVRRADPVDVPALREFAGTHFGAGSWPWEVEQCVVHGACHLAARGDELLGFAGWGALRPSLFGPMGTAPAAQGMGIGGVLLRRCLIDQRAAGLTTAQIGWAGPVAFYANAVGARIERVFVLYRKGVG